MISSSQLAHVSYRLAYGLVLLLLLGLTLRLSVMPKGSYIARASGSIDLVALSHLTFCWSALLHSFLWSYLLLLTIVIGLLYLLLSFLD